jgi:malate synthase
MSHLRRVEMSGMQTTQKHIPPMSSAPAEFSIDRDLPGGFAAFYRPLHDAFTARQQAAIASRARVMAASQAGSLPDHNRAAGPWSGDWQVTIPAWCQDQRNQMTGPADDAELVVKMLNSGAPGVMLDLEDSMANEFARTLEGIDNVVAALYGELTYDDKKRGVTVAIKPSTTVIWTRVRGMHLSQAGIYDEPTSAGLFDLALLAYKLDFSKLKHPLAIYIPKSESADEAIWWGDVFKAIAKAKGQPADYIKAMALVESHALAYQLEEFAYNLREHLIGLNLGRWDYMASLIHFNLNDPAWVLPDRNTIPSEVAFFQNLRELIPEIAHKHGFFAIGGMTAIFPSRVDPELNARAMANLEHDKKNEADALMDGAWTGHPDQNAIAVAQFPVPNQIAKRKDGQERFPDLRPAIAGVGTKTSDGTRAAVKTVIRYRNGYLNGLGASLLDGFMEDLATDRIYRLMIAQRIQHGMHTAAEVTTLFDEELEKLVATANPAEAQTFREARRQSEAMIHTGAFDPI